MRKYNGKSPVLTHLFEKYSETDFMKNETNA